MNKFLDLYKLLKYSNKTNDTDYLNKFNNNMDIASIYKLAKKKYINNQIGGEHIDLSECKDIFISNFHGAMVGESFIIPNNIWVIVPRGTGLINILENEEKQFFLQNKEKILEEFNKNTGKDIKLFNKNLLILKPGDSYCNVEIQIKFDNLIDEGLYKIEHAQKLVNDPFYRKINFGDVFANPLEENYLIGFNIMPKYKDILRLYLSKKNLNFEANTFKNDPKAVKNNIKNEIEKKGDRLYKISRYSKNGSLVVNNISRIMYPLLVNKTVDILNVVYDKLIQEIINFELPPNDSSAEYDSYKEIIARFQQTWGFDEQYQLITDKIKRYSRLAEQISTISFVLMRNINEINDKNLALKYTDNFTNFKKIHDNLLERLEENINYEVIFDEIFRESFDNSSSKKIGLIDNINTTINDDLYNVITFRSDGYINTLPIFNLMEKLDVNVKSLIMALYYWTSFHLIFCKVLSVMSDISLELLKKSLLSEKPMYLSDIVKLVNKTSADKKIIFSRSCQGFDSEVSIENAAKCLKYTTEFDLTNIFNQNDVSKVILAVDYIQKNNLDNIFNEEIGNQDTTLYYDLLCLITDKIKKSDVVIKIFIIYLKQNFIEIYNYFKYNMSLEIEKETKVNYFKYQFKIVILIVNLFIKSVYDKSNSVHKKNIFDIMNS